MLTRALLLLAAALAASPAAALNPLTHGAPPEILRVAMRTCIDNMESPNQIVGAFTTAGWKAYGENGFNVDVEAAGYGVSAYVASDPNTCVLAADGVGLERLKNITLRLMNKRYDGGYAVGRQRGVGGACTGYLVYLTGRNVVSIEFDGTGQDPICPDPDGAVVVITLSTE